MNLKKITLFLVILNFLAYLLTYAAAISYLGDLLINLNFYFIISSLLFLFFSLWKGPRLAAVLPVAVMVLAINRIAPLYESRPIMPGNYQQINLLQYNQYLYNGRMSRFFDYLQSPENNADLVAIEEVTKSTISQLPQLKNLYPYQVVADLSYMTSWQVALLSKFPIKTADIKMITELKRPLIVAEVTPPYGRPLRVYAYHASNPYAPLQWRYRNAQLETIADIVRNDPLKNKVVMGDFNLTPYSPWMERFLDSSGLKNSQAGFGMVNSWPSFGLFNFLRISIDQIFVSHGIAVKDRSVIDKGFGSDHLPITAEILVPAEQ